MSLHKSRRPFPLTAGAFCIVNKITHPYYGSLTCLKQRKFLKKKLLACSFVGTRPSHSIAESLLGLTPGSLSRALE